MAVVKNENKGWRVVYRYNHWSGKEKQSSKRGFKTKREAQEWEREYLKQKDASLDMSFAQFVECYTKDMQARLKENTWQTKENILGKHILPYFSKKSINKITAKDIMQWQNEILSLRNKKGQPYSPVYLKTVHNQMSAIFNHAVKFYNLKENPAAKVGNMGKAKGKEMQFWTKAEYLKFADVMMDKPHMFYAFEMLYWTGIRVGELLALTPSDFDFERCTVRISKSYQRLKGRDLITTPKTEKSNRVIAMSKSLAAEMQEYITMMYKPDPNERIFPITRHTLNNDMVRCSALAGVKRIRVHDLRHSHVSLLIDMGFSIVAISERLGHEKIEMTLQYAHLFASRETELADRLDEQRLENEDVT